MVKDRLVSLVMMCKVRTKESPRPLVRKKYTYPVIHTGVFSEVEVEKKYKLLEDFRTLIINRKKEIYRDQEREKRLENQNEPKK